MPSTLRRRDALAAALALLAAPRARAQGAITDALGFNYEEFTAVAGPAGWDRVVGFNKAAWASWRPSVYRRYLGPIPRLAGLPDVGSTDDGTFSLERVLSLRPDLVVWRSGRSPRCPTR